VKPKESNVFVEKKENKEPEKIVIPKIPVSSLYFEDSGEEETI
jgi:hypothetical protein